MDLLSVIRRWHHREGLPIREIKRRTGLSRITIRKYLASDNVEPKYPARKRASKLDPYAEMLSSWLSREAKHNRKRRRNLKQLHHDLVARWRLDAGDHPQLPAAPPADLDVNGKNPLETLCPGQRPIRAGRRKHAETRGLPLASSAGSSSNKARRHGDS